MLYILLTYCALLLICSTILPLCMTRQLNVGEACSTVHQCLIRFFHERRTEVYRVLFNYRRLVLSAGA